MDRPSSCLPATALIPRAWTGSCLPCLSAARGEMGGWTGYVSAASPGLKGDVIVIVNLMNATGCRRWGRPGEVLALLLLSCSCFFSFGCCPSPSLALTPPFSFPLRHALPPGLRPQWPPPFLSSLWFSEWGLEDREGLPLLGGSHRPGTEQDGLQSPACLSIHLWPAGGWAQPLETQPRKGALGPRVGRQDRALWGRGVGAMEGKLL